MIKKKGVSPLIATILLLAFAVSLATLILGIMPDSCKGLDSSIPDGEICYNAEEFKVELTLKNDVEHEIVETRIVLFPNIGKPVSIDLEDNIEAEGLMKIELDYDKTFQGDFKKNKDGSINMLIIPQYNNTGKVKECRANIIIQDIPDCATAE